MYQLGKPSDRVGQGGGGFCVRAQGRPPSGMTSTHHDVTTNKIEVDTRKKKW